MQELAGSNAECIHTTFHWNYLEHDPRKIEKLLISSGFET